MVTMELQKFLYNIFELDFWLRCRKFFQWFSMFSAILILSTIVPLGKSDAADRVRLALSVRNVVFLPFYYARDTKIFDRYELSVELIQMRSNLQIAGLISGEIDFTPAVGSAIFAVAKGVPLKTFTVLYKAPLFSLVTTPKISSLKELEGKRIAVSRIGSDSHRFGSLMIRNGGADPEKMTFIQTGSTKVNLTALQEGTVEGAMLSPPFTGIMLEKGYRLLGRTRTLVEAPWLGIVATQQKLEQFPEQARNMLRAMRDVIAIIRSDKEAIVDYIVRNFNVSQANAVESYEDIDSVILDSMVMRKERIQKYLDGSYARNEIPRAMTVNEMVDFSLVRGLK